MYLVFFFFSSRRRHTRSDRDWSSDVCSSDLAVLRLALPRLTIVTVHSALVQCGQRRARIEIFMAQCGHSFSVGAAGAGWRRALLMPLTTKNSAQATRGKLINALMKIPKLMGEAPPSLAALGDGWGPGPRRVTQ